MQDLYFYNLLLTVFHTFIQLSVLARPCVCLSHKRSPAQHKLVSAHKRTPLPLQQPRTHNSPPARLTPLAFFLPSLSNTHKKNKSLRMRRSSLDLLQSLIDRIKRTRERSDVALAMV